jgi:hypothetical protein
MISRLTRRLSSLTRALLVLGLTHADADHLRRIW